MMRAMWIEIDEDADPIAGIVHEEGRPGIPFHGWLQFAAALERVRTAGETAASGVLPDDAADAR